MDKLASIKMQFRKTDGSPLASRRAVVRLTQGGPTRVYSSERALISVVGECTTDATGQLEVFVKDGYLYTVSVYEVGGRGVEHVVDAINPSDVVTSSVTSADISGGTVTPGGGSGGATNLSATADSTGVTINSSSGTSATLGLATGTNAGLMAPADFTKLAGYPATPAAAPVPVNDVTTGGTAVPLSAQQGVVLKAAVDSVAANLTAHAAAADPHPGYLTPAEGNAAYAVVAHTHTKADVGLANVDNTSDAAKPISTAQAAVNLTKVDTVAGKALSTNDYDAAAKAKVDALPTYAAPTLTLGTATATTRPVTWAGSGVTVTATLPAATTTAAGLFQATDKVKLDTYPVTYVAAAATDLSLGTATATTLPLNSSTGADVTLPAATTSTAGLMAAADRVLLNALPINGLLSLWAADPAALAVGAITLDANKAPTSFGVVWPDGGTGVYTATTVSSTQLGSVDAYTVTYVAPGGGGGTNKTVTQPAVTRDGSGAVTQRPARTVA